MCKAVAVKFRTAQKHYFFDPGDLELVSGDDIVVETIRGLEVGKVRGDIFDMEGNELGRNLKTVMRKATKEDLESERGNFEKRKEAIRVCKERILQFGLEMKLIDAEYTFDGGKLVFYFTADKRVDFRDLVKDLAGYFRMRIELRQVGVRDEARLLGGFGSCGRELCCKSWLEDFEPVSIKMAKVQNLSLNPGKISGCCGRLMCCLKYENDVYLELKKDLPDQGEVVDAPMGAARVIESSIFKGRVKVKYIEEARTKDAPERLGNDIFDYEKTEVRCRPKTSGGGGGGKSGQRRGKTMAPNP
ncbi:stage 0 sporulation protein [Clostridia bacterium]|nr:stage 0 sporulation protein [Clostridia bacterium]